MRTVSFGRLWGQTMSVDPSITSLDALLVEITAQRELQIAQAKESQQRDQERKRADQIASGRCAVVPPPNVPTQPFRSELSVEQNSIFVSNDYKENFFERRWVSTAHGSSEPVAHRLLVGKVNSKGRERGVLTQTHQDLFYKILHLWGRHGYNVAEMNGLIYGGFTMSAYELMMELRGENSATVYDRIRDLLRDLVSIPIVLENTYTWRGLVNRDEFTLLGDVNWKECEINPDTGRPIRDRASEVAILISPRVTEGFLNKHIKMILGKPYESLGPSAKGNRGEIARLLYPFLDAQLASKDEFHIRLDALMDRFALTRYPYKSKRREKMAFSIKVLDGQLILGERYILRVSLREATDGTDYVLVARREPSPKAPAWKDE